MALRYGKTWDKGLRFLIKILGNITKATAKNSVKFGNKGKKCLLMPAGAILL